MLTEAQKQNYLANDGTVCPYCGFYGVSPGHIEGEDAGAYQFVTCPNCGKEWRDIYKLVDIEEVEWMQMPN